MTSTKPSAISPIPAREMIQTSSCRVMPLPQCRLSCAVPLRATALPRSQCYADVAALSTGGLENGTNRLRIGAFDHATLGDDRIHQRMRSDIEHRRSDERRVGKECVSTGRSQWARDA